MIRIIVREQDLEAVHLGGLPGYIYRTFDVDLAFLEKYLIERKGVALVVREVIGVEVVDEHEAGPRK